MLKKFKYVLLIVCVLLITTCVHKISLKKHVIPASEMDNNQEDFSVNEIIENVLRDTNRSDEFNLNEVTAFSVFYGDITENLESDVVIAIEFNNTTLVTVYSRQGDNYVYEADLGLFYEIDGVEFRYIENLSKSAVFLRERIDQSLGGFETNEFIRGYAFSDGNVIPIISIPADIESYWNEGFPGIGSNEDIWTKVTQESSINWVSGIDPEIIFTKNQNVATAEGSNTDAITDLGEFEISDNRIIQERYVWSDKWQRFILYERTYNLTGANVAVLEDLSTLPYVLAGLGSEKSRVLFENGDIGVVDNTSLE